MDVKKTHQLAAHSGALYALTNGRTSNTLFIAGGDRVVAEWDLESGETNPFAIRTEATVYSLLESKEHQIIYELDAHHESCNSLDFLPNGYLVTGGKDAFLRVWNGNEGFSLIKEIPAHNYAIYDIIVNSSSQWIATASRDKTIKIWDLEFNEKPLRLDRAKKGGHLNSVNGLMMLDDNRFASCSDDRSVVIWQVEKD